ncbi:DUF6090 family protein [Rhodohalobacter mucosus]|uniref:Four helix bundle sensory module for signal transduction n=1 Tax=Rhodohalobacter mucosus TaxID=2079485 RepID=A0A316TM75_9BACT|nr:DUF6090 family protein [Rhodohalobacter mucosus]PWN05500.1 hypothetical protein DDZ15_12900 [Rhodohalobacter mucosus]
MKPFFRKIRQKLISSGSISKYLLYATGEIALVMIGILLALQVNNWNEERKQSAAEETFMTGVKNDLSQDQQYINLIVESAEKKLALFDQLEDRAIELYQNDRQALDSLVMAYFNPPRTFYPIFGSYESAVSGNEISRFNNKEFMSAATRLYNSIYARLMDNAEEHDVRWFYNTKKYSRVRRTGNLPDMSREDLQVFLDDIYNYHIMLEYYKNLLLDANSEIEKILIIN